MPAHPVIGPEWIENAPIIVEQRVDIAAPPSAVWTHIARHEAWPEWFTELDSVERIGSGDVAGNGRMVKIKMLTLVEEFTVWEPDRHFAFAVVKSPFPFLARMAEEVVLEPNSDGTTVTYRQGLEGRKYLGGLMKTIWKPAPGQVKRALSRLAERATAG